MSKNILASIIIPTSNRIIFLNDLLISLRAIGYLNRKEVEVIIAGNGKKNNALKNLCENFGVIYIVQEKVGKSHALNLGINKARGEFIVFTDDDVIIKDVGWIDKLISHFRKYDNLGYVSGNVKADEIRTFPQKMWEEKGGLSKGERPFILDQKKLKEYKFIPWPLSSFCAGANCVIPKKVLDAVGLFSTILGPGTRVGHGESLEIGYRIIRAGYDVMYEPQSIVYHRHPMSASEIKRKLYIYGKGDTAIHAHIFFHFYDFRSLFWCFGGHQYYTILKIIKRILRLYPLPLSYIIYSLWGSCVGGFVYINEYLKERRR